MPRKVTKTMREARKRATEQKKRRRAYQSECASRDYSWGGTGPTEAELRNSRTLTVSKKRKQTSDAISLDVDFENGVLGESPSISRGNVRPNMSDEEYEAREAAAQAEIDRKRGQIAPAFNKGAYQYITSEEQIKDVYKK